MLAVAILLMIWNSLKHVCSRILLLTLKYQELQEILTDLPKATRVKLCFGLHSG